MDALEKIFGSSHRVRITRLFLFNKETPFSTAELVKRTKVAREKAQREISNLKKAGLIKDKVFLEESKSKSTKGKRKMKKTKGWILNEKFNYLIPLQNLLAHVDNSQQKDIIQRIKKLGAVKFLVISGVFIGRFDSRVDVLIVGDRLNQNSVDNLFSQIEAELGKEISYCMLDTKDFMYRLNVYDKLVRDILDFPHKKVVNKIDIGPDQ
jgi:hypothetical protein